LRKLPQPPSIGASSALMKKSVLSSVTTLTPWMMKEICSSSPVDLDPELPRERDQIERVAFVLQSRSSQFHHALNRLHGGEHSIIEGAREEFPDRHACPRTGSPNLARLVADVNFAAGNEVHQVPRRHDQMGVES
jgi:hypothetical protein